MAKKTSKGNGTSRVRFIMLEAEIPEGDLTQITTAIQNALKPSSANVPRVTKTLVHGEQASDQEEDEIIDALFETEDNASNNTSPNSMSSKPRKPAKRKVIDIDLDGEAPFANYVEQYPPKNDRDKYLVAVAFFSEHRKDTEDVSADHVYTCFRKVGWPTGNKDFAQPLRELKRNQLLDQGSSRGTYTVNHIGLDRVHKLAEEQFGRRI